MGEDDRNDAEATVRQVAELSVEPDSEFRPRLQRRIHRRLLAGELTDLSVSALARTFVEYVLALFGALRPNSESEEEER